MGTEYGQHYVRSNRRSERGVNELYPGIKLTYLLQKKNLGQWGRGILKYRVNRSKPVAQRGCEYFNAQSATWSVN